MDIRKKIVKEKYSIFLLSIFLIVLGFYGYIQIILFFGNLTVPDERDFLYTFSHFSQNLKIFDITNYLGYGSFYWIIGAMINDLRSLQILSLIYLFSIPIILGLIGKRMNATLNSICLAIFMWISFPLAWWYGKLIGPELMSVSIGLIGIYFSLTKSHLKNLGYLLIGFSIGIKTSSISFLFFQIFYTLSFFSFSTFKEKKYLTLQENKRGILFFFFFLILGFILANPFFLFDPFRYIEILNKATHSSFSIERIWSIGTILFDQNWTWDAIFNGGLFSLSISLVSLVVLFLCFKLFGVENKNLLYAILFTFVFTFVLLLINQRYLGWYWYAFISILPLIILVFKSSKSLIYTLSIVIITNFIAQSPLIKEKIDMRKQFKDNLTNQSKELSCLNKALTATDVNSQKKIYNISDFSKTAYADMVGVLSQKIQVPSIVVIGSRLQKHQPLLHFNNLFPEIAKNNCIIYRKGCIDKHLFEIKNHC